MLGRRKTMQNGDSNYNLGQTIGALQSEVKEGFKNLNEKFDRLMNITEKQQEQINKNTADNKVTKALAKGKHSVIKDVGLFAAIAGSIAAVWKTFGR